MGIDRKKIVWLASYPKSGNTWFRIFLSNLLNEDESSININNLKAAPIASSRILFDDNTGAASSDMTTEEIEELRPEIYRQVADEAVEKLFFKVHDAWKLTPSGKSMFPKEITKAVVYFIRNPLDVTVSYAFHSNLPPSEIIKQVNNERNAFAQKSNRLNKQIKQDLCDWSGHVISWVDGSGLPIIVLRYEDMITDTFSTFQKALQFIGIEKSENEVLNAIKASSFSKLQEYESIDGFKEKPIGMKAFFRKGSIGDWREHLSKNDVKSLIEKHKVLMERYGYLEENNPVFK